MIPLQPIVWMLILMHKRMHMEEKDMAGVPALICSKVLLHFCSVPVNQKRIIPMDYLTARSKMHSSFIVCRWGRVCRISFGGAVERILYTRERVAESEEPHQKKPFKVAQSGIIYLILYWLLLLLSIQYSWGGFNISISYTYCSSTRNKREAEDIRPFIFMSCWNNNSTSSRRVISIILVQGIH